MVTRTFVKICGITRPEDAHAAVRAGADAVGFVFAPSPRRVSASSAGTITDALHPSILKIGVFVDESLDNVLSAIDRAGLDGVQLQGSESSGFVSELRSRKRALRIFKVVKGASREELALAEGLDVDALFIDPKRTDDPIAPVEPIPLATLRDLPMRFVVAGGLNAANVGPLVSQIRPWGVDVSGGVEEEPGRKDHLKIRAFVRAVREADAHP